MDATALFAAGIQLLVLLLAISVHEASHALVAERCGDPTAREQGRQSLSPFHHIDPVGSLLVPVMLLIGGLPLFGWGRPTPIDGDKLKRPQRDEILVYLAGPLANLLLFVAATLVLATAIRSGPEAREAAELALLRELPAGEASHFPVLFTLVQLALLNAFLALFNLLPIPPLDGGQVLLRLLRDDWAARLAAVGPFGFTIVLGLALVQALTLLVQPIYLLLGLVVGL